MNSNKPVPEPEIIPDFFHDPKSKKRYERGRLLGKVREKFKQCNLAIEIINGFQLD
jgi:hypothetical protein